MKDDGKTDLVISVTRLTARGSPHTAAIPVVALQRDEVTVGTDYGCDITVDDPRLPASFKFLKKKHGGHTLILPYFVEGELTQGECSVPIQDLIKLGLLEESGGFYLLRLTPQNYRTVVRFQGVSLSFGYRQMPPARPAPPLNIPFISNGDYVFTFFLLISAALHIGFVSYLNTIEAKELSAMEKINNMEPRFAKLIFQPRKQKLEEAPSAVKKQEPPEDKAAKKVEEKVKTKKKPPEARKPPEDSPESSKDPRERMRDVTPPTRAELALARAAVEAKRKRNLSEKVRGKGLLGVIGAKGGVLDKLGTDQVLMDLDNIITTARAGGGDGGGDGSGAGGGGDELGGIEFVKVDELRVDLPSPKYKPGPTREAKEIIGEKKKLTSLKKQPKRPEKTALRRKEASVYRVVKSYTGGLKYLYNKALRKDPSLRGTITAAIVIDASGRVTRVEITDSTVAYAPLERSIMKRIKLWKFERIAGAEDFTITYTFDFAPVG